MRVEGMGLLAAQPNVAVKISGLGMADYDDGHYVSVRGCDAAQIEESIRPFVLETIEAFGVERCMLASNFPCAPRTSIRKLAQRKKPWTELVTAGRGGLAHLAC